MCGIAGVFLRRDASRQELCAIASAMSDTLRHRGPDDRGEWTDERCGVAFGFRRLAIIDLSEAGHQPMQSSSGRFVIMFNGEVYNFEAIREELECAGVAPRWRGHSDTEVLLAAFERWGVAAAVQRFVGMFAIALWDGTTETLHLIRDRIGVKPLYYSVADGMVVFGSELKALVAFPRFTPEIDTNALGLYTRYGYVPAPCTIYRNTWKQGPGTIVSMARSSGEPRVESYWSLPEVVTSHVARRFSGTEDEALSQLDDLATDAVGLRMISDVPLGVFLSGGIDSSIVAALMQKQSARPIRTFSIGFREDRYDEAKFARRVAGHLGTDHTEMYVSSRDALDVIPLLPSMYDEPFADSSQIPTFLVSKLARRSVTVSLSGDGGDELFGGYNRYFTGRGMRRAIARLPRWARAGVGSALTGIPASAWNSLLSPDRRFVPARWRLDRAGERVHKFAQTIASGGVKDFYHQLVTQWEGVVPGARDVRPAWLHAVERSPALSDPELMMFFDQLLYLPDDILVKVDRASMAVSLEAPARPARAIFRGSSREQPQSGRSSRPVQAARGRMIVIFQNEEDRAVFVDHRWVRPSETVLIPGSGVDPDEFVPRDDESTGKPVVMFASRMLRTKGLPEFIDAVRLLNSENVSARYVLVGAPDAANPASVTERQLHDWVGDTGVESWGHRADMSAVLRQADVVCLLSHGGEGVPKVLIEAAACAIPIVTTDVPGCRDIVVDGESGFVVPKGDARRVASALRRLIEDSELRRRLGTSGRKRVQEKFSLAAVLDATMRVYERLTA